MRRSESLQASSWIHVMCFIVSLFFFFFFIVAPIALTPPSLHMESREKENVKAVLCVSERGSLEAPVATLLSRRLPSSIFFFFHTPIEKVTTGLTTAVIARLWGKAERKRKRKGHLFFFCVLFCSSLLARPLQIMARRWMVVHSSGFWAAGKGWKKWRSWVSIPIPTAC